ncbi:MAG: hypothetical protein ACYCWE_06475 [Eubacteriales bacterium]
MAISTEPVVDTIRHGDVIFEVINLPETIFAGKLAYANALVSEPDIGKLLNEVRSGNLLSLVNEPASPGWDAAVNIDYWRGDAVPRGMMFARETVIDVQPSGIDVYKMPSSMFMRVFHDDNAAKMLNKNHCDIWELFGLMKETVIPSNGYEFCENGAQEFEYYNWSLYKSGFASVPVKKI